MYKWLGNKVSGIPEISELSMSTSIDFVFSLILGKWWYNNPELLFGTLMDLANLGSNIGLKATVWKFLDFIVTQILSEINVGEST